MIVLGLTAMPVSTAQVTRRRCTAPASSTSDSTTVAMKLPKDGCAQTPRPTRAGNGEPQPDFSAASLSAAFNRGVPSSMPRRKATGSMFALRASSSMKLSIAKTLLFGPTPRQNPVITAGGSARTYSTRLFGMSYGMSTALSTASGSSPFWNAGGIQRAITDEPVTLYFQATILPLEREAEIVSRYAGR